MSRRAAWPALVLVGLLAATAVAQGPVYRERWSYARLEQLRSELCAALQRADDAARQRAGAILAAPLNGNAYLPTAQALAALRGVPCDDAFVVRAMMTAFVLPEVVDPDGSNENCRALNVSLYLPIAHALPDPVTFVVELRDAKGKVVAQQRITDNCGHDDLRMAAATAAFTERLPDGAYRLAVQTWFGEQGPRAGDPDLELPCWVLRGYQARVEQAMGDARSRNEALPPATAAALRGIAAASVRVYTGEPRFGDPDPVRQLGQFEQALANLAAGRGVLAGITGDVLLAVPGQGADLPVWLTLGDKPQPRPLLVLAPGRPSFDGLLQFPEGQKTTAPELIAARLRATGMPDGFAVAIVESPGAGRPWLEDLIAALPRLRELLATGERPVHLVVEREAAMAVGLQLQKLDGVATSVTLVGGGGVQPAARALFASMRVQVAPVPGHSASDGLRGLLAATGNVPRGLTDDGLTWPCALPQVLPRAVAGLRD